MKGLIKKILSEELGVEVVQVSNNFDWAKDLKFWGKSSGWRKGVIRTINKSLRDVYSSNWERPTKKHMSSGGVVGYEVANGSTFGWSILNFFNAHRDVRNTLIDAFAKYGDEAPHQIFKFTIKDFTDWIWNERHTLFGKDTTMVKKLATLNHRTWNRGSKNEGDAVTYLNSLYSNNWGADWSGEPGMFSDAITGVDITMINKNTGLEHGYQAKPFVGLEMKDNEGVDEWWVESRGLYPYNPKTVNYYIFNTSGKSGVVIFKNKGQKPTVIDGKEYMVFDYPPVAQSDI
jgi:hypothetical protein